MFKKPTVFILGAGASWHYGYPTGEGLVREVLKKCSVARDYFRDSSNAMLVPQYVKDQIGKKGLNGAIIESDVQAWDNSWRQCEELAERLKAVDPLVIDYFLGQNQELQDIGRLLITWVIRERETQFMREQRNVNRSQAAQDNWIRFVSHRLVVGCTTSRQIFENDVCFVTFNYDMSLEDKLLSSLRGISLFASEDITEFFGNNRFLHVYGKIRDKEQPDLIPLMNLHMDNGRIDPRFAQGFFDELYRASKGIRTIDPHDKTDEETLQRAKTAILRAKCVYILGYGFDARNSERLGLNEALRPQLDRPKYVLFTNLGDVNRVNKAASKVFLGIFNGFPPGYYLHEAVGLSRYEKSARNCYDALALDFDEIEAD